MNTRKTLMLVLLCAIVCVACAGVGAADDVNVTLAGHFGGATWVVAVSGDYAYIGQGQDLVVLDISDPASPVELGRAHTGDIVYGIALLGDYAYVADGYCGLVIVDVSNKGSPSLAGSYDTAGYARGVTISGDYAYVADLYNGLVILRIDVPVTPQIGDLNSDGILTSADAVIALRIATGSRPCDAATLAAAGVSGDDRVTSPGTLMILQATAGAIKL